MSEEIEVQVAEKKTRKRYGVDPEKFVRAWQASETAQEVADRLGMPKSNVLSRAANYRKKGVVLKEMKRSNVRQIDVEQLNGVSEED